MKRLEFLKKKIRPGRVYRRIDLQQWSSSIDRHLQELTHQGTLKRLSGGLYYAPKPTVFGEAPADEKELITAFLKDSRFVLISHNDYNNLGVGTTQLYNERYVYNQKRHGTFKLGTRRFHFVRKPNVPSQVTPEFLLVDLVNNMKYLAEDHQALLDNVQRKAKEMDASKLKFNVSEFGTVGAKKRFAQLLK